MDSSRSVGYWRRKGTMRNPSPCFRRREPLMPFDPNVIRPDEPPLTDAGDLLLPDHLAELATQLGEDARHLASVYPARLPGAADVSFLSADSVGRSRASSTQVSCEQERRSTASSYRLAHIAWSS